MVDELNQKISQLIDDDLSYQESLSLLKKIKAQPDLQHKLQRYEAISHALKSEAFVRVDGNFAQRVALSLQAEPVHIGTRRAPLIRSYAKVSALAASAAALAVLVFQGLDSPTQPQMMAVSQPMTIAASTELPAAPPILAKDSEPESAKKRFIEYLQAHNSSRYIDEPTGLQPHARTVRYQQE